LIRFGALSTDFVKRHYCLSQRTDARFWIDNIWIDNIWIDNTDPASIPDSLRAKPAMWRAPVAPARLHRRPRDVSAVEPAGCLVRHGVGHRLASERHR
jgi:hypothetical protein